jgi:hypothetical protein
MKMTLYKLVFGQDLAHPLDLISGRPPDRRDREPERYVLEMRKRLDAAMGWARTNIGKYIRGKEWRYNAERKVFQTGVKVWLLTPVVDSSTKRKLSNYWSGPWTVEEKLTDLLYRIRTTHLSTLAAGDWMLQGMVGIKLQANKKQRLLANHLVKSYKDDAHLIDIYTFQGTRWRWRS